MNFFSKSAILLILLLSSQYLHAQDSLASTKFKRNALKVGVSLTWSKYFLTYEHAFTKHISVGVVASYALGNFPGYTGTVFSRYYFKQFNKSGLFIEARGSYSHYSPNAYSDYEVVTHYLLVYEERVYLNKHKADIDYWSGGISGGYKFFIKEKMFFEFLMGLHYGVATFGKDDIYFSRGFGANITNGSSVVKRVFNNSGPGNPWHFMCTFGYAF